MIQPVKNFPTPIFFEVWEDERMQCKSLHTIESLKINQVICYFTSQYVIPTPNYLSLQVNEQQHIVLAPEYLTYINHSCDPYVFFDTTPMCLIALRNIRPVEEITFFYPYTEWVMAQGFACVCGSANC
jgi:hypothetical protein